MPDARFDTFVGASENSDFLQRLAEGNGAFAFLSGPQGSGKTHLLMATLHESEEQGVVAQYVSLPQYRQHMEAGLSGLENAGVILLDDLDQVLGRREDEIALFDFHNRARANGCAVVYSAAVPPIALPPGLPDLRSRLGQCTQLTLSRPDETRRQEILRRKAQVRGLMLDDAATAYLLRRVERDMPSLVALLDTLDRASLAEQRRLTVPFIRSVLERPRSSD